MLDMHASLTDQERKAIGDDEHEQKHSCARFLRATCTTKRDKKTSLIVEVTYSFDKALARARMPRPFKGVAGFVNAAPTTMLIW